MDQSRSRNGTTCHLPSGHLTHGYLLMQEQAIEKAHSGRPKVVFHHSLRSVTICETLLLPLLCPQRLLPPFHLADHTHPRGRRPHAARLTLHPHLHDLLQRLRLPQALPHACRYHLLPFEPQTISEAARCPPGRGRGSRVYGQTAAMLPWGYTATPVLRVVRKILHRVGAWGSTIYGVEAILEGSD